MAKSKLDIPKHIRLYQTGKKVRRVIGLLYIEDMEAAGKSYYDLLGYLDHIHQPAIVSPIHDRDHFTAEDVFDWCERHIDPETGDLDTHYLDSAPYVGKQKKPHIHLGLMSTTQYTAEEWTELMDGFMHIRPSIWEKMLDYDGFVKYCAHLDSPDKAKYNAFDIHSIAGASLTPLMKIDDGERITTIKEIYDYIEQEGITRFHVLFKRAMESGDVDWINIVTTRGQTFVSYFNSLQWQKRDKIARETRELERQRLELERNRAMTST